MFAFKPVALLALAAIANAIQVTSPDNSTTWSSSSSAQTIQWNPVATDPTSFTVQLVNQAGFLQNSPVTLTANQSTFGTANAINSASVTYPGGTWPTGTGFQINFVSKNSADASIYAQSAMFTISNTGSASSASSPTTLMITSSSVTSATPVMTVTSASGSGSGNSGDASGGIPNASTTSKSAGEFVGAPSALVSLLIGAAGFLGLMA